MHRSRFGRRLLMLAAVVALLAGCGGALGPGVEDGAGSAASSAARSGFISADPSEAASARAIRFAVMGDSLTAWAPTSRQESGAPVPTSWLPAALGMPLEFRGGWAVPGASTLEMRAGARRLDADVLVVLAGTNDILYGVPWESSRENLLAVVAATGIDDVLLVAVPPLDSAPVAATWFRFGLAELAAEEGWQFLDPWAEFSVVGGWAPGASSDGVHPAQPVADAAGRAIRATLLDRTARKPAAPR